MKRRVRQTLILLGVPLLLALALGGWIVEAADAPADAAARAALTADPPARTDTSACTRVPAEGNSAQMTSTITSPTATNRTGNSGGGAAAGERHDLGDGG